MMGHESLTLIYIMGDGRSGSTVVDIMLGNHPDIVGIGEICKWPQFRGQPILPESKREDLDFWNGIHEDYKRLAGEEIDFSCLTKVQDEVDRYQSFLRVLFGRISKKHQALYLSHTERLLDVIVRKTGKNVIVDSSKNMGRAHFLAHHAPFNVKILHVIRDPRGIVSSTLKTEIEQPSKKFWMSIVSYWVKNCIALMTGLLVPKGQILRVKYEDLMLRPDHALLKIGSFVNMDMGAIAQKALRGEEFTVQNLFHGNRIRNLDKIRLKYDDSWRQKLSRTRKAIVSISTFPFLAVYGYLARS